MRGRADVVDRSDHPFGIEKSEGQLAIVARGPHGDGEGIAGNADFERFFDGDFIDVATARGAEPRCPALRYARRFSRSHASFSAIARTWATRHLFRGRG